jgi:hypothetical protein
MRPLSTQIGAAQGSRAGTLPFAPVPMPAFAIAVLIILLPGVCALSSHSS